MQFLVVFVAFLSPICHYKQFLHRKEPHKDSSVSYIVGLSLFLDSIQELDYKNFSIVTGKIPEVAHSTDENGPWFLIAEVVIVG